MQSLSLRPAPAAALGAFFLAMLLPLPPLFADDAAPGDVATMASELSALRGQVEAQSQELEAVREAQRAELRALATQRSDLELAIRREELHQAQLAEATRRAQAELAGVQGLADHPSYLRACGPNPVRAWPASADRSGPQFAA